MVRKVFRWYNDTIPCPPFKAKQKSKKWTLDAVAWWRQTAREPISMMQPLIRIVRDHGDMVRTLRVTYPGKIVYRDKYQVVAETPQRRM